MTAASPFPVYTFSDVDRRELLGIVCDDDREIAFQSATLWAQEALGSAGAALPVERVQGFLDRTGDWIPDPGLFNALQAVDRLHSGGPQWRLFTLATVTSGPLQGLRAIGIGSNQKKLIRASNLALAITAARRHQSLGGTALQLGLSSELQAFVLTAAFHPAGMAALTLDSPTAFLELEPHAASVTSIVVAAQQDHEVPPPPPPPWPPPEVTSVVAAVREDHEAPPPPPPWPPPDEGRESHESKVIWPGERDAFASSSSSAEPIDMRLVRALQNDSDKAEIMTICTLSSNDTIPLGTDLDPRRYSNLWAAQKIEGMCRKLVEYNLGRRVIDAENLGYSYGSEVKMQAKCYDDAGVKAAIVYFAKRGVSCVVVTPRDQLYDTLRSHEWSDGYGVEVVKAQKTDDVIVIKQAEENNCPIVSRDGFEKWKVDRRIERSTRDFLANISELQVRFSWGKNGNFIPDFELDTPVLCPSRCQEQPVGRADCAWCQRSSDRGGRWGEWSGQQQWYCTECWEKWRRT